MKVRKLRAKICLALALLAGTLPALAQDASEGRIWMRVTLGTGYEKPVYLYIFADHFRAPWYGNHTVSKAGLGTGVTVRDQSNLLSAGETTGWVDLSSIVYPDTGARLVIAPLYAWGSRAGTFDAQVEFAPRPGDDAVARSFRLHNSPASWCVVVPPKLDTRENVDALKADAELAAQWGELADKTEWPVFGKAPVKFPFFVSLQMSDENTDAGLAEREYKTLSYFGFNNLGAEARFRRLHGLGWRHKGSFSAPDLERLEAEAAKPREGGPGAVAFAMLTDEPTGEPAAKLAADPASIEAFRVWLQAKKLQPEDLSVSSWEAVKPVAETERDKFPALHYYTQQFRTVALGNFIALQKDLLFKNAQSTFPVNVNFSDGAVYYANFYGQGVDYFTLLRETNQNALWSEDWSNGASTYQDASYNVALMRAAAREGGQHLGQHLIAYAGRKGYDIRLKAVSEAARGIKVFNSFAYGPVWATHEKKPWQANPAIWGDHAAVIREIGAVEDLLVPAQPKPAEVAVLYSSAADIWNLGQNQATGFERMHTWLALTHAQIPVDIVHESQVAEGQLDRYKVCYVADPNLTRTAAAKLKAWVLAGGTLIMTAGAGQRDEYNRPLATLDELLPYHREPVQTLQPFQASGRRIPTLRETEKVSAGTCSMGVLSLKQSFTGLPTSGIAVEARFADGSPAAIRCAVGRGTIVTRGFLPALDYIRQALVARDGVQEKAQEIDKNNGIPGPEDVEPLEINRKSYNPWEYPASVRDFILNPARVANINPPLKCNTPLVDAVYMTAPEGVVIPLANYTLKPIEDLELEVTMDKPFSTVRSVHQGVLKYRKSGPGRIQIHLPLGCTDFVTIQ